MGVRGDERLELGGDRARGARRRGRPRAALERREPCLLEPARLGLGEGLVGEVGQGRAAPEREGLADRVRPRRGEPLEPLAVELLRLDADEVAGRAGRRSGRRRAPSAARGRAPGARPGARRRASRPRSRRSAGRSRPPRSRRAGAGRAAPAAFGRRAATRTPSSSTTSSGPSSRNSTRLQTPPRRLKPSLGGS